MRSHQRFTALAFVLFASTLLSRAAAGEPVHIVYDVSPHPELAERAALARDLCVKWYPILNERLFGAGYARPFSDIRFEFGRFQRVGHAEKNLIQFDSYSLRTMSEHDVQNVVIHELVHVIENYKGMKSFSLRNCTGLRSAYCFLRVRLSRTDRRDWVSEGIADYITYTHFDASNEPRLPPDMATSPKLAHRGYRVGYKPAASFLLWLEQTRDKDIVRKLNIAARENRYSPALFQKHCGASLDALWREFVAQSRPAAVRSPFGKSS